MAPFQFLFRDLQAESSCSASNRLCWGCGNETATNNMKRPSSVSCVAVSGGMRRRSSSSWVQDGVDQHRIALEGK